MHEMGARRGIVLILSATALAGIAGYLVQVLVPLWIDDPSQYVQFGVFWSITFLCVSMISGMQQEVTRAVSLRHPTPASKPGESLIANTYNDSTARLVKAGLVLALGVLGLSAMVGVFGSETVFTGDPWALAAALAVALLGYVVVALLSGVFYGLEHYGAAAMTTGVDAVFRLVTVLIPGALGLGLVAVSFGVGIPFALTALVMWFFVARRLRDGFTVDVGTGRLLRNGLQTMLAALATGVLMSGLPAVLSASALRTDVELLASIVLALSLTRAPLVVPVLALQSYLVVQYQRHAERAGSRALVVAVFVVLATGLLAGAAAVVGPWVLKLVYAPDLVLSGELLALVVISGGSTAVLASIAPLLLARGLHTHYLLSWIISVVATVVSLILVGSSAVGVLWAIALAPVLGWVYVIVAARFTGGRKASNA